MDLRSIVVVLGLAALGTSEARADEGGVDERQARRDGDGPLEHVGVALKADALGPGVDAAVAIARTVNLRVGMRALELDRSYQVDGILLDGSVRLRSFSAYLDWFPGGGGFHLSPGVMVYNGNRASADARVPAGERFTIGGTELLSSSMDPVSGTASIDFASVAPALVIGWGNIVPRGGRWSVPFELGVVYTRAPSTTLALRGTACSMDGDDCRDIARDPLLQARVAAEEASLEDRLAPIKVLPIVSLGVGYKF
jgi:hypothetical protein